MTVSKTAKATHRVNGGDLQTGDRFGQSITTEDSRFLENLQAETLSRRYRLTRSRAAVVAGLVFQGGDL